MSIFNVAISRDGRRAVVSADTLSAPEAVQTKDFHSSKLLVLPHINSVAVGRGWNFTLLNVLIGLQTLGIDDIVDALDPAGQLIDAALKGAEALPREKLKINEHHDCALVGYSKQKRSMVAFVYIPESQTWTQFGPGDWIAAPGHTQKIKQAANLRRGRTDGEDALEVARVQFRELIRTLEIDHPALHWIGGHLTVAELDPDEMRLYTIHNALGSPM